MASTTAPIHDRTRFLLPAAVDHYATHTPTRVYASIPINPTDLGQGFRDITYAQLSLAVDRAAHWLDAMLGAVPPTPPSSGDDRDDRVKPTFAYLGPRDLRYPIFVLAAIKVGGRIGVISFHPSLTWLVLGALR